MQLVDPAKYARECHRIESLDVRVIASCHGPTIEAPLVERAHALVRQVPDAVVGPPPDQAVLDQIIAAFESGEAA